MVLSFCFDLVAWRAIVDVALLHIFSNDLPQRCTLNKTTNFHLREKFHVGIDGLSHLQLYLQEDVIPFLTL